jgi:hypothetical protein
MAPSASPHAPGWGGTAGRRDGNPIASGGTLVLEASTPQFSASLVASSAMNIIPRDTPASARRAPEAALGLDHVGCHASRSMRWKICRKSAPVK